MCASSSKGEVFSKKIVKSHFGELFWSLETSHWLTQLSWAANQKPPKFKKVFQKGKNMIWRVFFNTPTLSLFLLYLVWAVPIFERHFSYLLLLDAGLTILKWSMLESTSVALNVWTIVSLGCSSRMLMFSIGDCGVHAGSSKAGGKSLTSTMVMTKLPSPTWK